jgi:ParB family chromosome partitioning protein
MLHGACIGSNRLFGGVESNMKKALGKGLGALLAVDVQEGEIKELKINEIEPNLNQPRKEFDEESLRQLADSIAAHGIIQPIVVRKEGMSYKIVAGERRWRAARMAGIETVPAIVREYNDNELLEVALIENLQRENLNPLEEAEAYKRLIEEYGLTQEQISKIIGKSRPSIANSLRLNKLHDDIKKMLRDDLISEGHARAILSVEDPDKQIKIAEAIVSKGLSVRDAEKLVKDFDKKEKIKEAGKDEIELEIRSIEDRLKNILGTKVRLQHGKNKGKIVIDYYSNDDLDRILNLLKRIG